MKKVVKQKKVKIMTGILVLLAISLIIIICLLDAPIAKKQMPNEITSIEELLAYYKCTNAKIKDSEEEQFETDIYLNFGEDLWVDGKANKAYYDGIILYLTELLQYQNYRMIDSSRELVIAVEVDKQNKKIEKIYINGELNYFAKEETRQMVSQYKEVESTAFNIQAEEIQKLIKNNWEAGKVTFGTLESRFDEYDIYFEEGIEVKNLGGKVYNIVFTEKYKQPIINNLKVNEDNEKIIQTLGKPNFEADEVIGYKGEECYVFFSENQVSVYRREKDYQTENFLELWKEFQQNKNAKTFVNQLTDLWKDYNQYQYDSNYIFLEYALKGIRIQFSVSAENGIVIYNNYEGNLGENITIKNVTIDNLPEHVYLHTDEDLVFMNETARVATQQHYYIEEYRNISNDNDYLEAEYKETYRFTEKKSTEFYVEYQYVPEEGIRDVKFISLSRNYPNSELIRHKQIYTYGWLNDEQFVYSVKREGIFCYNAKTRKLTTLITGSEPYKIKKVEEGMLFYDETSVRLK